MEIENHIFKESKYFKSPNFNDRPNSSDIRLLVIHCISLPPNNYGGDYVKDFFLNKLQSSEHEYFESIKNLKVSSHLFINRAGEVLQFVPFDKRAWHAGESSFNGVSDCNNFSIGIELEGSVDDFYSEEQYKILIDITNEIIKKYPLIKKDCVVGHSDVSPGRKSDPGDRFDWKRFLEAL